MHAAAAGSSTIVAAARTPTYRCLPHDGIFTACCFQKIHCLPKRAHQRICTWPRPIDGRSGCSSGSVVFPKSSAHFSNYDGPSLPEAAASRARNSAVVPCETWTTLLTVFAENQRLISHHGDFSRQSRQACVRAWSPNRGPSSEHPFRSCSSPKGPSPLGPRR